VDGLARWSDAIRKVFFYDWGLSPVRYFKSDVVSLGTRRANFLAIAGLAQLATIYNREYWGNQEPDSSAYFKL